MSHVGRSAGKKIVVKSRYRSASVSRKTVSASSPNRDTLPSFSINDSVASSIPSRKMSTSLSSRTVSKQSPFLSDEELMKWSNRTLWKFLVLKSRRALEIQVDQEDTLRKTIMKKRVIDGWLKQWLVNQKSLDEEVEIYRKMVSLLEGDTGVISLLRRFHDNYLAPVSSRLPVHEVTIGDDLLANLKYAFEAQNQARAHIYFGSVGSGDNGYGRMKNLTALSSRNIELFLVFSYLRSVKAHNLHMESLGDSYIRYRGSLIKTCLEQQKKGLDLLSQQISELSRAVQTSVAWTANREDVLSKFTEASRLLLHHASLHAHRRQLEIIEKIDNLFL
ncbi:unnamed protein product [Rodentolepis nana]|uniref:HAUS augmin-like complex subunit 6 n=1 Tax=Rodentolepis nana TaxID=102285 RepID=A0A0R3T0P7_RODNA|nr:unnamed protein product [Rodentolepis nana]